MVGLAIWVASAAIRIEWLNAEAGYYLPRRDQDGKWRISQVNTPCDQLREMVTSVGVLQYLFAPLVVVVAAFHLVSRDSKMRRCLAAGSGIVGLGALGLAFYRGYFSSLGW
jgi:hypothetical protein